MSVFAAVSAVAALAAIVASILLGLVFRHDGAKRRFGIAFVVALFISVEVAAIATRSALLSAAEQALLTGALMGLAMPLVLQWRAGGRH